MATFRTEDLSTIKIGRSEEPPFLVKLVVGYEDHHVVVRLNADEAKKIGYDLRLAGEQMHLLETAGA